MTKLRYLPDVVAGYRRIPRGRGYYYLDPNGERVTDRRKLGRFRALAIPPAWKDVWISPSKRGHLQATGIDGEGRKQYRYHPEWTAEKQHKKLLRMCAFGEALPSIRKQILKDLRREVLDKPKVVALALKVMEKTLIRVGNEQYRKKYGSHGLTTLRKKHLTVSGNTAVLKFKGKKGVKHLITVRSRKLAGLLAALADQPGTYLFQYRNGDNELTRLGARDVNAYLQTYCGSVFSSKDFRTWYAGVWALRLFAERLDYTTKKDCNSNILSVLDAVSRRLGNTRTVCKQYYVPARLVGAYEDGTLLPYLRRCRAAGRTKNAERHLLVFLKHVSAETA